MPDGDLTWLRPWAWLMLAPWLGAVTWWWQTRRGQGPWRRHVDAHLLDHVTVPGTGHADRRFLMILLLSGLLTCAALAGPSWRTQPVPLFRDLSARVVVLDVSPSMMSIDVTPNRLAVAKDVVAELLRTAAGQQLGLVVFAGDAFTVAPLTRDAGTLLHLLHSIDMTTLPRPGARVDLGLRQAATLLRAADIASGDVYLVGDSHGDARAITEAKALHALGFPLSVVAVGTEQGGPVRLSDGALAREDGEIVVTRLPLNAMAKLADAGQGTVALAGARRATGRVAHGPAGAGPSDPVQMDDVKTFTAETTGRAATLTTAAAVQTKQIAVDDGYWLIVLILPLFIALCRRGWLMSLAWIVVVWPVDEVSANGWQDWWARPDQQAASATSQPAANVDAGLAAKLNQWPRWQAIVLMRSGDYAKAAQVFATFDDATGYYNQGNALALSGDLQRALAAYDTALSMAPDMHDALFNRALVREALARQRERNNRNGDTKQQRSTGSNSGQRNSSANDRPQPRQQPDNDQAGQQAPQPLMPGASADASGASTQEQATEQAKLDATGAELKRLEGLLGQIPDEPGALLKNRFAIEFKLRTVKHRDTGANW